MQLSSSVVTHSRRLVKLCTQLSSTDDKPKGSRISPTIKLGLLVHVLHVPESRSHPAMSGEEKESHTQCDLAGDIHTTRDYTAASFALISRPNES